MLDPQIREAFINQFLKKRNSSSLIFEEVGILKGKSIVDIAIFNEKFFQAFEIKSGSDSSQRLQNQIESYAQVFDTITLITESNQALKIMTLVPKYWGIIIVDKKYDKVIFEMLRMPKRNILIQKKALIDLLWKDEAVKILKDKGIKGMSSKRLKTVLKKVDLVFESINELRCAVYNQLKNRSSWKESLSQNIN